MLGDCATEKKGEESGQRWGESRRVLSLTEELLLFVKKRLSTPPVGKGKKVKYRSG